MKEDEKNNYLICDYPFRAVEIKPGGDVAFCCSNRINTIFIGNIFNNTLDEIWNSEVAVDYRKRILNQDYSLCDKKICFYMNNQKDFFANVEEDMKPIMETLPNRVNLGYDFECNSNCIYCRDKIIRNNFKDNIKLDAIANKTIIPLIKNARNITLSSSGECLASKHSRNLIKKISKINPQVKFEIMTNGILANKKTFKALNIEDKIYDINVTVNAATKETHEKICRNKSFDRVMNNLLYLSTLKKENIIYTLTLSFVVSNLNYFEMPEFQKLSNRLGAFTIYWEFRNQEAEPHKDFDELAVHLPTHRNYNDLLKILKDPIFDDPSSRYMFNPVINSLREKSITTFSLEH